MAMASMLWMRMARCWVVTPPLTLPSPPRREGFLFQEAGGGADRGFLAVLVLAPDLDGDAGGAVVLTFVADDAVDGEAIAGVDRLDESDRHRSALHEPRPEKARHHLGAVRRR